MYKTKETNKILFNEKNKLRLYILFRIWVKEWSPIFVSNPRVKEIYIFFR